MDPGLLSSFLKDYLAKVDLIPLPSPTSVVEVEFRFGQCTSLWKTPASQRGLLEALYCGEESMRVRDLGRDVYAHPSNAAFCAGVPLDPHVSFILDKLKGDNGFIHLREETSVVFSQTGGRLLWQKGIGWRYESKITIGEYFDVLLPAHGVDIRMSVAAETPSECVVDSDFINETMNNSEERHRCRQVWRHPSHNGWEVHSTWVYRKKGHRTEEECHIEVERCDAAATVEGALGILIALLPPSELPMRPDWIDNPYPLHVSRNMLGLCSRIPFPPGVIHDDVLRRRDLPYVSDGQYMLRCTFKGASEIILTHIQDGKRESPIAMTSDGSTWTHAGISGEHSVLSCIPDCVLRVEMVWCGHVGGPVAVIVDVLSHVKDCECKSYSQRMAWINEQLNTAKAVALPVPGEMPIVAVQAVTPTSAWSKLLSNINHLSTCGGPPLSVTGLVARAEKGDRALLHRAPEDVCVNLPVSWTRYTREVAGLLKDESSITTDHASFEAFRRHFPKATTKAIGCFRYYRGEGRTGTWALVGPSHGLPSPSCMLESIRGALCDHLTWDEIKAHFMRLEQKQQTRQHDVSRGVCV